MITLKVTGNLETFAKKMNLSKRSIADLLFEMREMGAIILYDRSKGLYYYSEKGEMSVSKFMC